MRDIKKDVVYGKIHENKIKPTIDKIFGELTLSKKEVLSVINMKVYILIKLSMINI